MVHNTATGHYRCRPIFDRFGLIAVVPIFDRDSRCNTTPPNYLSRPIFGSPSDYRCRPIFDMAPAVPLLNTSDMFAGQEFIEFSNSTQCDAMQPNYSRSRLLSHYRPKALRFLTTATGNPTALRLPLVAGTSSVIRTQTLTRPLSRRSCFAMHASGMTNTPLVNLAQILCVRLTLRPCLA